MNNSTDNTQNVTATQPVPVPDAPRDWRGMTLEELQRARGKALVRREVGRVSLEYNIEGVKSNFASNGVRALMFSPGTVNGLKTADYVLLGFKLTRWLMNVFGSRRRRR